MRGDEFFMQMAGKPPFSRLHPKMAAFFKDYLSREKAVPFGDHFVLNTHFPPYPGPAFDGMVEHFNALGTAGPGRRLFSVTWAVTNRCDYRCWHCYNAGRSQDDLPLDLALDLAGQLQGFGAVKVNLTGGEPLLRDDLAQIADAFDDGTFVIVGTTGDGLTAERARELADAGVFATGISLDSTDPDEHDRLRGRPGAFRVALDALQAAGDAGLYPYVVAVATRELLERGRFMDFLAFAQDAGAREVHLLEPATTGRLKGRRDVALRPEESQLILDYQTEIADRADLPILSSFTYLESSGAFGCGAGLTHLYVDGSGEVCPCNLVPMSFGNVRETPLVEILDTMSEHFQRPRCVCVGRQVSAALSGESIPSQPDESHDVCRRCLPTDHDVPRFFAVRQEAIDQVGADELRAAYDRVHGDYDEFWVVKAGRPVDEMVARLDLQGGRSVFEAGCGTGYGTAQLAAAVGTDGRVVAVDLSEGMLHEARRRLGDTPQVEFVAADALQELAGRGLFDVVFTSWVLGYIPLAPFFAAAAGALGGRGRLAFVVHKLDSPRRETGLFAELVAEDPSVLLRQVDFDFPRDLDRVRTELEVAGLAPEHLSEGAVIFEYPEPADVLEHLLKSGAGTAFYDAIDPGRRDELTDLFLARLSAEPERPLRVVHDYVACIASLP